MTTTIRVHKELLRDLNAQKKEMGVESYEEVIRILLKSSKKLRRTHFGTLPMLKTFKREEIDRLE